MMPEMRRTPVVAAVVGAVLGVAVPACDLVFAPGPGPGATADAPTDDADADGENGGDGSTADAAPGTPDAATASDGSPPPDAACAPFQCYAPDVSPGTPDPNNPGLAGCELAVDDACAAHPEVVPIDACTCSARPGAPELYVFAAGADAVLAFVGPGPLTGTTFSLVASADPTNCFGGGACTQDGPCFPGTPLWVWQVPISSGPNQFQIFEDTGGGCGPQPPVYTFTISL
jgi:hypothetical protein